MSAPPAPPEPQGYTHIAGFRLKEHAERRQRQAGVPTDAIKAAILYGREMKSKSHGRRRIMVLNKRAIKQALQNGLHVCFSWTGLGVVIEPGNKTICTVDRQLDPNCRTYRRR